MPDLSVVALDLGLLLPLSGRTLDKSDVVFLGPNHERGADIVGAVISHDRL